MRDERKKTLRASRRPHISRRILHIVSVVACVVLTCSLLVPTYGFANDDPTNATETHFTSIADSSAADTVTTTSGDATAEDVPSPDSTASESDDTIGATSDGASMSTTSEGDAEDQGESADSDGTITTTQDNGLIPFADPSGVGDVNVITLSGTMRFINCTINIDSTSYITSAGNLSFDDCVITGTNDRTSALISLTGGTTTVSGTTTISGITNIDSSSSGGVFNVTGGATLNLDGGTISDCNINAPRDMKRGGAVAYVDNGTINLTGTTIRNCGNGVPAQYACGPFSIDGTGTMNMSGGTITECNGSHGGAACVVSSSASFNMTGGTISSCHAHYDGGAIFLYNNASATVGESAQITGNSSDRNGAAIGGRSGSKLTISGSPVITGNNCTGTEGLGGSTVGAVGGFDAGNHGTITISGNPTISGNTYKGGTADEQKADLVVYDTTSLKVGDMGSTASVGICSPDANLLKNTARFATASSGTASTTTNLYTFFNDKNPVSGAILIGTAGTGDAVVWGKGTCQIIRDGQIVGIYATLSDACAAAHSNDRIEVFKSHELTSAATLSSSVVGVTVTTAPTTTPTVAGAYVFEPAAGESSTEATVIRAHAYTGTLLSIAGTGEVVDNLVLDGGSTAASSAVVVAGGGELTLKDAAVQNCKTNNGAGAVNVAQSGTLKVTGAISLHSNTDAADAENDNNVRLASNGTIQIIDSLAAGSSIGVTVQSAEHVAYHKFAQGYDATGNVSTEVAAASVGCFFDDTNPVLTIGANSIAGHADLETYLYFQPPTEFQFYKVTDSINKLPLAGATFHLYRYIGGGIAPTVYLTDSELLADTGNWTIVPNTGTGTNDFSSGTDGLVDCGGLDDGYVRIVEVSTPTGFTAPTCEWQMKVDSSQADPNKFVFTRIDQSATTVTDFQTTYDALTETTTYSLPNTPETGILYVSKGVTGSYADATKPFTFTAEFSEACTATIYNADGSAAQTSVAFASNEPKEFTLSNGQYLIATNMPDWSTCIVTETDAQAGATVADGKFYTCSMKEHPGTAGNVSLDSDNKQATVTFNASGMSGVDFTNAANAVAATGVTDEGYPWWILTIVAGVAAISLVVLRLRRHAYKPLH